jgi:hypothetical protein
VEIAPVSFVFKVIGSFIESSISSEVEAQPLASVAETE